MPEFLTVREEQLIRAAIHILADSQPRESEILPELQALESKLKETVLDKTICLIPVEEI